MPNRDRVHGQPDLGRRSVPSNSPGNRGISAEIPANLASSGLKHILIVTDAWHPQVNGVVTVLGNIIRVLKAQGHKVIVLHPGMFRTIPFVFFYPEIRLAVFPRRELTRLLRAHAPDFIHIATEGPLGSAARAACRTHAWCFTTSYHTHYPQYVHRRLSIGLGLVWGYMRKFHNAGAATMASTPSLATELVSHAFRHVVVCPLGVDTALFVRNEKSNLPAFPPPVFVYFGRLAVEKGPEEVLRLPLPGTKLVIGDGPDRRHLEKKYGGAAHFVGYKRGQELVDWLSRCDVCVLPSRTETFGLVVLEALACGIPVAAHDVMGPRDIITNGVDGVLDEDLLRAACACVSLSRALCREKALGYSWENSANAFLRHLIPMRGD